MKYRIAGLLSLGLAAGAYSTLYTTGSTSAQPPLGSSSASSHDHDHDHDGHNHSRQQSSEPPAPNANAIIAPSGGPPPLPTTTPGPSTNQNGDIPGQSPSSVPADSPPSLLPPSTGAGNGFQPGNYDCPNARQYDSRSQCDVCLSDFANHLSSFPSCDRQYGMAHVEPTAIHCPSSYRYGVTRDYEVREYRTTFDATETCYDQFGHDVYGYGATCYGHRSN
ncbi:MAG: hypothetical protein H6822_24305 [Planctomycetaceae bacterium]|nr:hypothetical protein [Planctomycetales bacterium]MCB9925323.1 hypothetical protein [Planctomycetaceae bacterium]